MKLLSTAESHVQAAIAQLIEEDNQAGNLERRQEARYPYFQAVTIIIDNGDRHLSGITRQISRSGIGLLHRSPLDMGRVEVNMWNDAGYALTLPMGNVWCRPCGAGWYTSGGRFLDLPVNGDSETAGEDTPLFDEILYSVRRTIDQVVEKLTRKPPTNRRSEERHYATLPVTAVPVDAKSRPIRDGFQTVTRDISGRGIALFTSQALNTCLLAVEIADRDGNMKLKALMQVLRCRPVGSLYEVAGKFVTKVYLD